MASANKKNKNLAVAGLASAAIHGLVLTLGCLNIFEPPINSDLFVNVELAGAAELQQALNDYDNQPIIEQQIPEPEVIKSEEIAQEQPINESLPKTQSEPMQEVTEEHLVRGPSIVESSPEPEPGSEERLQDPEDALPPELQNEDILRLEKEKLEQEKIEKQQQLRKEQEDKRRLEKEKKLRKEKIKRKKEAQRRRKKRLEAIKRIEKKNKEKKKRLAKIADVIKKNNEVKKREQQTKNFAFDQMLKNEKKTLKRSSYGKGLGNGNGLGSYGDGMGFTNSDAAIISNQIIPHWVVAGGVKNAETLVIRIRIKVKDNGEVPASSIEILDKGRYNSDRVFKSAADSAKRAILKASPLKIPPEKVHLFKDFEFSFNTDKALGVKK